MYLHFLSIALMGFGSGFSLLFSSQVLVTFILDKGGSIDQVGFVSLLTLPYMSSFLWMPGYDYLCRYISRQWVIAVHFICLGIVLYFSSFVHPVENYLHIMLLGFLIALMSATNDHIIEAYRLTILKKKEYKLGVSISLMAFRIGIMLAGGIGLIYAASYGWHKMYQHAAFLLATIGCSLLFAPDSKNTGNTSLKTHLKSSWQFLRSLLQKKYFISVLVTYRLSVFWLELMMPALLMRLLGLSVYDLGLIYKLYGVIGLLLGGVVVNFIVDQRYIKEALFWCLVTQIGLSLLFFQLTLLANVPYLIVKAAVFLECFLQGVLGTVSTIWLMQKTKKSLPAFSFAIWHGLSALGRVCIGPISAVVIDTFGWSLFALVGAFLALLSTVICRIYIKQDQCLLQDHPKMFQKHS